LIAEKSGVLNLSVEGMMAIGAVVAFMVVFDAGGHWTALLVGGVAATVLSGIFAVVVLFTLSNQVVSGLAVGLLGVGVSGLIGRSYEGLTITPMSRMKIPFLSDLPVLGPAMFNQPALVYAAPLLAAILWWVLKYTRVGLIVRAVGESPESANAVGFNVTTIRFLAILFGGFLAGVAGAFLAIASATLWADGMIAGRGWIVIALVVFAMWRVERAVIGAYLFGAASIAELLVQSAGISVPSQLMTSIPYIVTIVAVSILSMDGKRVRLNAPASLGRVYLGTH
jgi:simple sugar transport system permease protein